MNVGIDLGTTYSLIAQMGLDGHPVLIPDYTDKAVLHTPSVVYIDEQGAFVGQMVEMRVEQNPSLDGKVIRLFKRHLGEASPIHYDSQGNAWYPEAMAALVLKKLCLDAESYTSSDVEGAVITIPAHFNDLQRKAVYAAAALAEIPVLGLLEEPIAAALHYGVASGSRNQTLMVYDLGGGTFDATVLAITKEEVHVLAKDGLTHLGGKEFDEQIGAIVLSQFQKALGTAPTLDARTSRQLSRISEELKIELCIPGQTYVRRVVLLGDQAVEIRLRRREFEQAITELIEQTEIVTYRCLESTGLSAADVDALLLVGGSSMAPIIKDRMSEIFNQPEQHVMFHNPTKAVALGAALHTCQISGDAETYQLPPELKGVTGYCVGVQARDPRTGEVVIDTLIKKNMPLPAKTTTTYYTIHPKQERIVLQLYQYRDSTDDVVCLGEVVVGPLPSPKQNYPIEVTVENREDSTVTVQAYDPQTGAEVEHTFRRGDDKGFDYLAVQRKLVSQTLINNIS